MHPTSNPQQITPLHQSSIPQQPLGNAAEANLLDHDHGDSGMNDKMTNLNMNHEPMVPDSKPLKRIDTETSDTDVFVDAES